MRHRFAACSWQYIRLMTTKLSSFRWYQEVLLNSTSNRCCRVSVASTWCTTIALIWQYQPATHRLHSYQLSFTAVSRCVKLSTVSIQATCIYCRVTYWQKTLIRYDAVQYKKGQYLIFHYPDEVDRSQIHGPARTFVFIHTIQYSFINGMSERRPWTLHNDTIYNAVQR